MTHPFLDLNREFDPEPEEADVERTSFVRTHSGWGRKYAKMASQYDDLAMFVRGHRQAIDKSMAFVAGLQSRSRKGVPDSEGTQRKGVGSKK